MKHIVDYCNSLQERIVQNKNKNKDSTTPAGVEKLIYSTDKLLHLITKRKLIEHEIQDSSKHFYASSCSKDPVYVNKFNEQIKQLVAKKKELFNPTKLRRTVIYGIPCTFVKFDDRSKDITE